jgi:hypothetical protein
MLPRRTSDDVGLYTWCFACALAGQLSCVMFPSTSQFDEHIMHDPCLPGAHACLGVTELVSAESSHFMGLARALAARAEARAKAAM